MTFWITSSPAFTWLFELTLENTFFSNERDHFGAYVFQVIVESQFDHFLDVSISIIQVIVAHDVLAYQVIAHEKGIRILLQKSDELLVFIVINFGKVHA